MRVSKLALILLLCSTFAVSGLAQDMKSPEEFGVPDTDQETQDTISQRTKLIYQVNRSYWNLTDQQFATMSGVPPSLTPSFPLSDGTVEEKVGYLRNRAESLNWNYGADQAVNTWKTESREQDKEKKPDGPEDVSISGNTYFVSSDTGHVMRDGNAAAHCYESLNYLPPNYPPETIFPQVPANYSKLNPDNECPNWISQENMNWIPSESKLKRLDTYCPSNEDSPNSATFIEDEETVSYIDTECVKQELAPICGSQAGEICQAINEDICNQFDQNCNVPAGSGEVSITPGGNLEEEESYDQNTIILEREQVQINSDQTIYVGLTDNSSKTTTNVNVDLPSSTKKFKISANQNYFKKTVSTGEIEGSASVKVVNNPSTGIFDRLFGLIGGPKKKVLAEKTFRVNKVYTWEKICERENSNFDESRKFSATTQCMNNVWFNCSEFEEGCNEIKTSVCEYGDRTYNPETDSCVKNEDNNG